MRIKEVHISSDYYRFTVGFAAHIIVKIVYN